MNELLEFLTSKEIIIVYIISALACLICFIVYLIEKNNDNLRKKHNTKELNKLVEEIRAALPEEEEEMYDVPILEVIEEKEESSINDLLNQEPMVIAPIEVQEVIEPVVEEVVEDEYLEEYPEEELQYTTMEPDPETARRELRQLQEQLERQESMEKNAEEPVIENIELTNYEEEQERTAIISMEELYAKSKEMYAANELTQYQDEGNEPICLQDLERQAERQATVYEEPFIIANVVMDEESGKEQIVEVIETKEVLHMDDFNTIKEATVQPVRKEPEVKKFKSTPFISPIFGIERDPASENEMALENTANYEKLDEEIRKTNEFVMSLKELQRKLD